MIKNGIALWTIVVVLTGCGSRLKTVYDHKINFTKYKSFGWMKGREFTYSGPKYLEDSLVRKHIEGAIIDEMKTKGIAYTADHPELLIDIHISVKDETEPVYHSYVEGPNNFVPLANPMANPEVINFLKGTLVIDIADRAESRMVWRSVSIRYMDIHPDLTPKNIRNGIAKGLKEFPPRAESK